MWMFGAALEEELGPFLERMDNRTATHIGAWTCWSGTVQAQPVLLYRTDEGPLNAAASTALAIERFQPEAVVNYGIAGAHRPDLEKGDLVLAADCVDYSGFRSTAAACGEGIDCGRWTPKPHKIRTASGEVVRFASFPSDPQLLSLAQTIAYDPGRVITGRIGSALQYNLEVDRIEWIRRTYATDCEDQESAFVAGVAVAMGRPFLALRVISDSVFNDPVLDKKLGRLAAEFAMELAAASPAPR